jgi:hypothetical protein
MNKFHNIEELKFYNDSMLLKVDGKEANFNLKDISNRLFNATLEQRNKFEFSPSGYGIHWELIDEDLSIDGLFKSI